MHLQQPQSLSKLINQSNKLNIITQKAVTLAKLNQVVTHLLPKNLKTYCRVANYRQHQLIMEVATANRLMLLRYEQENLLHALRADILPSLQKISMYINPHMLTNTQKSNPVAPVIANTIEARPLSTLTATTRNYFLYLAQKSSGTLKEKFEKLADNDK